MGRRTSEGTDNGHLRAAAATRLADVGAERQWALGVIDRAMAMLRADLVKAGKEATFEHLKGFLIGEKEE